MAVACNSTTPPSERRANYAAPTRAGQTRPWQGRESNPGPQRVTATKPAPHQSPLLYPCVTAALKPDFLIYFIHSVLAYLPRLGPLRTQCTFLLILDQFGCSEQNTSLAEARFLRRPGKKGRDNTCFHLNGTQKPCHSAPGSPNYLQPLLSILCRDSLEKGAPPEHPANSFVSF